MVDIFGLLERMESNSGFLITEPLGYLDFISLLNQSSVVITDSGGLQEETSFLGIPCLTIRDSTERPITVEKGSNTIVGTQTESIIQAFEGTWATKEKLEVDIPFWDGKTAERIADILFDEV